MKRSILPSHHPHHSHNNHPTSRCNKSFIMIIIFILCWLCGSLVTLLLLSHQDDLKQSEHILQFVQNTARRFSSQLLNHHKMATLMPKQLPASSEKRRESRTAKMHIFLQWSRNHPTSFNPNHNIKPNQQLPTTSRRHTEFSRVNLQSLDSLFTIYPQATFRLIQSQPSSSFSCGQQYHPHELSLYQLQSYMDISYDLSAYCPFAHLSSLSLTYSSMNTSQSYHRKYLSSHLSSTTSTTLTMPILTPYHTRMFGCIITLYKYGGIFSDFTFLFLASLPTITAKDTTTTSNSHSSNNNQIQAGYYLNSFCLQGNQVYRPLSYESWQLSDCYTSTLLYFPDSHSPLLRCVLDAYQTSVFQTCIDSDAFYQGAECVRKVFQNCFQQQKVVNRLSLLSSEESLCVLESFGDDPLIATHRLVYDSNWTVLAEARVFWLGSLALSYSTSTIARIDSSHNHVLASSSSDHHIENITATSAPITSNDTSGYGVLDNDQQLFLYDTLIYRLNNRTTNTAGRKIYNDNNRKRKIGKNTIHKNGNSYKQNQYSVDLSSLGVCLDRSQQAIYDKDSTFAHNNTNTVIENYLNDNIQSKGTKVGDTPSSCLLIIHRSFINEKSNDEAVMSGDTDSYINASHSSDTLSVVLPSMLIRSCRGCGATLLGAFLAQHKHNWHRLYTPKNYRNDKTAINRWFKYDSSGHSCFNIPLQYYYQEGQLLSSIKNDENTNTMNDKHNSISDSNKSNDLYQNNGHKHNLITPEFDETIMQRCFPLAPSASFSRTPSSSHYKDISLVEVSETLCEDPLVATLFYQSQMNRSNNGKSNHNERKVFLLLRHPVERLRIAWINHNDKSTNHNITVSEDIIWSMLLQNSVFPNSYNLDDANQHMLLLLRQLRTRSIQFIKAQVTSFTAMFTHTNTNTNNSGDISKDDEVRNHIVSKLDELVRLYYHLRTKLILAIYADISSGNNRSESNNSERNNNHHHDIRIINNQQVRIAISLLLDSIYFPGIWSHMRYHYANNYKHDGNNNHDSLLVNMDIFSTSSVLADEREKQEQDWLWCQSITSLLFENSVEQKSCVCQSKRSNITNNNGTNTFVDAGVYCPYYSHVPFVFSMPGIPPSTTTTDVSMELYDSLFHFYQPFNMLVHHMILLDKSEEEKNYYYNNINGNDFVNDPNDNNTSSSDINGEHQYNYGTLFLKHTQHWIHRSHPFNTNNNNGSSSNRSQGVSSLDLGISFSSNKYLGMLWYAEMDANFAAFMSTQELKRMHFMHDQNTNNNLYNEKRENLLHHLLPQREAKEESGFNTTLGMLNTF